MTVLLVDDDPDQLFVREMLFEQAGFQVLKAAGEAEALRLSSTHNPLCALIDLCLPEEADGLHLITHLKESNPEIQIVVLTGKRHHGLRSRPEWKWVSSVITKGSPSGRLLAAVMALQPKAS